ncbi:MAG: site-2 protease family protein [Planctomycetota bacterium]
MNWSGGDLGADSGRGRASRFFARVFENPENPLGWSVKAFAIDGITVRVHIATLIYVVSMLLWSIPSSNAGIIYMVMAMVSLVVIVTAHEFGHCYACRWVEGEADRIVLLPFGGLALCLPPNTWRANLITTVGGPAVNVALFPVSSIGLIIAGAGEHVLFNPLNPIGTLVLLGSESGSTLATYALTGLWWFHYINIIILGFNVLLPMFPLDGGRIVQALLWKKRGYKEATEIAVLLGFAGAIVLGIVGVVANETMLLVIALFGAWACWVERKRVRGEVELSAAGGLGGMTGEQSWAVDNEDDTAREPSKREIKRQQHEAAEQAELDRILAKISEGGMDSLSRVERATLKKSTEKRKKQTR